MVEIKKELSTCKKLMKDRTFKIGIGLMSPILLFIFYQSFLLLKEAPLDFFIGLFIVLGIIGLVFLIYAITEIDNGV